MLSLVTKFSNNEVGKKNTALKIENIILSNANLFNNFEKKKFIIFFEGWEKRTSLFADIYGRSRFNGKIAIFYTSGKWKKNVGNKNKMFSCLNDSLNLSAEEEFGESDRDEDEFDRVHDNHYLHIEQFNALYEED